MVQSNTLDGATSTTGQCESAQAIMRATNPARAMVT